MKNLIHFDSIPSTNDYAKKNYKKLKHGTVILANEQTHGRGRFENKWFSPKGKGLYFSILVKPRRGMPWHAPTIELLNIIPAYAVLKTLHELFGIKPQLKYPNDILINGKKIGGVLVETKFAGKKLVYAVIGIGLNVNGKLSDFSPELRKTSAFINAGACHGMPLLINIIKNLDSLLYAGG